jgi:hypothetical protein
MKIVVAKNKSLELTIKNGRTLLLKHNIDAVKINREKNEIVELDFYGNKFSLNREVQVEVLDTKYTYKIRSIVQTSAYSFELSCCQLTKSSIFLLPLITEKDSTHDFYFYNTYFYNAYIRFEEMNEYNDDKHLFLVYRFFLSDYFKSLEKYLQQHKTFVRTFEPNKEFTVYVMEIPLLFQRDCRMILKGKYSIVTPTAKSKIITFHKAHIESELSHILHRSDKLREKIEQKLGCSIPSDVELHSKPDLTEETCIYGRF